MSARGRFMRVAFLLRVTSYETLVAALSVSIGWRILDMPGAAISAIFQHAPGWEAVGFAIGLIVGGVLTLSALLMAGLSDDQVRRTLARRVEQAGQSLLAGMFVAPALAAFQLGPPGYVMGSFDLGVTIAAACRVVQIHRAFALASPPELP